MPYSINIDGRILDVKITKVEKDQFTVRAGNVYIGQLFKYGEGCYTALDAFGNSVKGFGRRWLALDWIVLRYKENDYRLQRLAKARREEDTSLESILVEASDGYIDEFKAKQWVRVYELCQGKRKTKPRTKAKVSKSGVALPQRL